MSFPPQTSDRLQTQHEESTGQGHNCFGVDSTRLLGLLSPCNMQALKSHLTLPRIPSGSPSRYTHHWDRRPAGSPPPCGQHCLGRPRERNSPQVKPPPGLPLKLRHTGPRIQTKPNQTNSVSRHLPGPPWEQGWLPED